MNGYPVLKGASYTLAITPDMVIHNGTTQTTEMIVNPESEYLKELPNHLRSFEDAVSYIPNQVYIGNAKPADLAATEFPFYDKKWENASRAEEPSGMGARSSSENAMVLSVITAHFVTD